MPSEARLLPSGEDTPAAATPALPVSAAPPRPATTHLLWWISLAVVVADQITKAIVRATLSLGESHSLVPGFLDFVHVRNEGVAFGLFNSVDLEYKWILTTALAGVALLGIAYYARHIRPHERLARIGLSLILGGAFGNLIDRLHAGYVVDFVDVYWNGWHFWAFNVADASITIGAILVFVELLLVKRHVPDSV